MRRRDLASNSRTSSAASTCPVWLAPVVARLQQVSGQDHAPTGRCLLRPAAVLVLLIDSPGEPQLLLTERAGTLRHDAGTLVFPGGAAEADDEGPAATALREAAEEVGIDTDTVHIVGLLPPLAVPAGGFLVTAAVGWCERLARSGPANPPEVAAVVMVP